MTAPGSQVPRQPPVGTSRPCSPRLSGSGRLPAEERRDQRERPAAGNGLVAAVLFSLASLFALRAFRSARRH